MDFKTGLILGAAIGYVVGARAGRDRYDQMVAMVEKAAEHPTVIEIANATETPRIEAMRMMGTGLRGMSEMLRKQAERR